jgi:hypothetical protein
VDWVVTKVIWDSGFWECVTTSILGNRFRPVLRRAVIQRVWPDLHSYYIFLLPAVQACYSIRLVGWQLG